MKLPISFFPVMAYLWFNIRNRDRARAYWIWDIIFSSGIIFFFDKGLLVAGNVSVLLLCIYFPLFKFIFLYGGPYYVCSIPFLCACYLSDPLPSGVMLTIGLKSTMQFFTKPKNYKVQLSLHIYLPFDFLHLLLHKCIAHLGLAFSCFLSVGLSLGWSCRHMGFSCYLGTELSCVKYAIILLTCWIAYAKVTTGKHLVTFYSTLGVVLHNYSSKEAFIPNSLWVGCTHSFSPFSSTQGPSHMSN